MDIKLLKEFISALDDDSLSRLRKEIVRESLLRKSKSKLEFDHSSISSKSYDTNLSSILADDWSSLFHQYDDSDTSCYVYMHGNPLGPLRQYSSLGCRSFSLPIYVGMGKGDRAFNFKRGTMHTEELSYLEDKGHKRDRIAQIIKSGLTERKARELESKLILFFGIKSCFSGNKSKRRGKLSLQKSCLLNAQYEPMPEHYMRMQK